MSHKKVALLFGGESSEHEVSIASAKNVYAAIDARYYEVVCIYIDRAGVWHNTVSPDDLQHFESKSDVVVAPGRGILHPSSQKRLEVDVILPILHGKNGEDGTIQSLAQLLHIPIVGCDMTASAIAMDKIATKEVLSSHDIKVVPYRTHELHQPTPDVDELFDELGSPLFIKPSRAGSSVGVSRVSNKAEFEAALYAAHQHDDRVLIEKGIDCRELEVAILGTFPHERVSSVGEVISGEVFYSYEDKYSAESRSHTTIPAQLDNNVVKKVREAAQTIYNVLHCSGLSRVDFFIDPNNTIYFNEINTLPGFTNISMYPKLWQYDGVSYAELIHLLIQDALNRSKI